MNSYDAVLFISFGGPEKREDVMPFLEIVTQGRGIPRERLLDVAEHYYHFDGKSPINEITRRQAAAVEQALQARGFRLPVYIGQRNWHPFMEDTLRKMKDDGIQRAVGFITSAHRSEASLERYVEAVASARGRIGASAPEIDFVETWHDHPLFIEALVARAQETLAHVPVRSSADALPTYFIAHSIPCSMALAASYVRDLSRTAELVSAKLGISNWKLAYSSRSGSPQTPWLVPDINDVIREEAQKGHKDIFFITIGFIADHVEVLFDQDVEARETAEKADIQLHRTATVGDHPLFIQMITDVITRRLQSPAPSALPSSLFTNTTCFCYPGRENPPCRSVRSTTTSSRHG